MDQGNIYANVDFSRNFSGFTEIPVERSDNTGTAKLFEEHLQRANATSSAAAGNTGKI